MKITITRGTAPLLTVHAEPTHAVVLEAASTMTSTELRRVLALTIAVLAEQVQGVAGLPRDVATVDVGPWLAKPSSLRRRPARTYSIRARGRPDRP